MKLYSEDDVTRELKSLNEAFQPSTSQKESAYRAIFKQTGKKRSFRRQRLLPVILTLILFFTVGTGMVTLITSEYGNNPTRTLSEKNRIDVTSAWNGVILTQSSQTSPTNYIITFYDEQIIIQDDYGSFIGFNPDGQIKDPYKGFAIKDTALDAGKYENYTVLQEDDQYTITVTGKETFTYTLTKTAPRKFVGSDGVEYSSRNYIE